MRSEYAHRSDEELLRFADGELSSRNVSQVNTHLAACWDCRTRLRQLEETIAEFVEVHHRTLDAQLPPSAGPRALLKARLAQPPAPVLHSPWLQPFQRAFASGRLAYVGAMVLVVALGTSIAHHFVSPPASAARGFRGTAGAVPDRRLTPGVSHPLSTSEVCTMRYSDDTHVVPASVRQEVFQEYGMAGSQSKDYELDYLISPQLGGTGDIRNLWPEPSSLDGWNMRVKDALEDRLHQLVCRDKIDLSTAQRELATDWIAAYKKYFHTERPMEPL